MEHTSRYSVELLASLSHSTVSLLSFLETHLSQAPKTISGSFRHTAGVDPTHTVVPTHTEPNALNSAEALQDDAGRVCVDDHCASRHTRHESAPPRRGSPSHLREALTFVHTPCAPSSTSGSSESSGGSLTVCGARASRLLLHRDLCLEHRVRLPHHHAGRGREQTTLGLFFSEESVSAGLLGIIEGFC